MLGDFNFQLYGEEKNLDAKKWTDIWKLVNKDAPGFTYDCKTNAMVSRLAHCDTLDSHTLAPRHQANTI